MPQAQPELKKVRRHPPAFIGQDSPSCILQYMEKRVFVQLNGNRKVLGILRGYDVRERNAPHCTQKSCCAWREENFWLM